MNKSKEFYELAQISQTLKQEYLQETAMWNGSPFEWITHMSSRSRGTIGEKIVSMWLASYDFNILRSPDSEADRIKEIFLHHMEVSLLKRYK